MSGCKLVSRIIQRMCVLKQTQVSAGEVDNRKQVVKRMDVIFRTKRVSPKSGQYDN